MAIARKLEVGSWKCLRRIGESGIRDFCGVADAISDPLGSCLVRWDRAVTSEVYGFLKQGRNIRLTAVYFFFPRLKKCGSARPIST